MKEKDIELKQLIKEAVLEALMEFTNPSVAAEVPDSGNNNGGSGNGNGSGNGPKEPDPFIGPSGFSLR